MPTQESGPIPAPTDAPQTALNAAKRQGSRTGRPDRPAGQPRGGRSLGGGGRLLAAVGLALGLAGALGDAGGFAAAAAQVIELGAADAAAAHELDRVDHGRIEREHALNAFAVGDLAHREVLVEAVAGAADAHALISLHTGALALDDLHVHDDRVARSEFRNVLAGGQLFDLLVLELLYEVHGKSPSARATGRRGKASRLIGFGPHIRHAATLVIPVWPRNSAESGGKGDSSLSRWRPAPAQSVIAMARSAIRSRADSFSVALLTSPHAARLARPRGASTGDA